MRVWFQKRRRDGGKNFQTKLNKEQRDLSVAWLKYVLEIAIWVLCEEAEFWMLILKVFLYMYRWWNDPSPSTNYLFFYG